VPPDAIVVLVHDHADLNRQVIDLGAAIANDEAAPALKARLDGLREHLFHHFAQEEEGLFPFVVDHHGELADRVHAMVTAHDAICGAVARMAHLAGTSTTSLRPLFERFEVAYAAHAKLEGELLRELEQRLDPEQRAVLGALVSGL
jgi:iron-sulfur cluster repair protein YtfE (RIC family)